MFEKIRINEDMNVLFSDLRKNECISLVLDIFGAFIRFTNVSR